MSPEDKALCRLEEADEHAVRYVARILGRSSAAAQALEDLDRRRANGECVAIFRSDTGWYVGPIPMEWRRQLQ